jgi:hypothetical protein
LWHCSGRLEEVGHGGRSLTDFPRTLVLATPVVSTTLATVAYDAAGQVLWLEFRSHAVYGYFGVPAVVHRALLEANSKGAYFNRYIRDRFPYQRVATPLPANYHSLSS